jgi:hypothetical protein
VAKEWDNIASMLGFTHVLEKTPKHVHCLAAVRRVLPSPRIVLVVRNPLDNVASLFKRFPDNLEFCINRWCLDNRAVLREIEREDVVVVTYERFVEEPENELMRICKHSGLQWEETILEARDSTYLALAKPGSNMFLRAVQTSQPITRNVGKYRELLTQQQVTKIYEETNVLATKLGLKLP